MRFLQGASAFQQITGLSVVKTLTVPSGATGALIQPITQNVYMSTNGVAPSSTVGQSLIAGQQYYFDLSGQGNGGLEVMQFLEVTPSATLNVIYTA